MRFGGNLKKFRSYEGKMEHEVDMWTGAASAAMQVMYRTFMLKRDLSL